MAAQLTDITGIGTASARTLMNHGFTTVASIANSTAEKLSAVPGFSVTRSQKTVAAAKQLVNVESTKSKTTTTAIKATAKKKIKRNKKKDKVKNKKKDKKKKDKKKDKKKTKDKKKSAKSKSAKNKSDEKKKKRKK